MTRRVVINAEEISTARVLEIIHSHAEKWDSGGEPLPDAEAEKFFWCARACDNLYDEIERLAADTFTARQGEFPTTIFDHTTRSARLNRQALLALPDEELSRNLALNASSIRHNLRNGEAARYLTINAFCAAREIERRRLEDAQTPNRTKKEISQ